MKWRGLGIEFWEHQNLKDSQRKKVEIHKTLIWGCLRKDLFPEEGSRQQGHIHQEVKGQDWETSNLAQKTLAISSPPVSHSPGLAGIFKNGLLLPYWFYNLILCKYKLHCQGRPWKLLCWLFLITRTNNYSNKRTNSFYLMSIYHEAHIVLSV